MALHEFVCAPCTTEQGAESRFSLFRSPAKGGEPGLCPACGSPARQVISATLRQTDGKYSFNAK